jgi:hypothetical protein
MGQSYLQWQAEVAGVPYDSGRKKEGWKSRARQKQVKLDPDRNYRPGEVAVLLGVSYDTGLRRMKRMKGMVDMRTQTKRCKRGKKLLVISGRSLQAYLRNKTIP